MNTFSICKTCEKNIVRRKQKARYFGGKNMALCAATYTDRKCFGRCQGTVIKAPEAKPK